MSPRDLWLPELLVDGLIFLIKTFPLSVGNLGIDQLRPSTWDVSKGSNTILNSHCVA